MNGRGETHQGDEHHKVLKGKVVAHHPFMIVKLEDRVAIQQFLFVQRRLCHQGKTVKCDTGGTQPDPGHRGGNFFVQGNTDDTVLFSIRAKKDTRCEFHLANSNFLTASFVIGRFNTAIL